MSTTHNASAGAHDGGLESGNDVVSQGSKKGTLTVGGIPFDVDMIRFFPCSTPEERWWAAVWEETSFTGAIEKNDDGSFYCVDPSFVQELAQDIFELCIAVKEAHTGSLGDQCYLIFPMLTLFSGFTVKLKHAQAEIEYEYFGMRMCDDGTFQPKNDAETADLTLIPARIAQDSIKSQLTFLRMGQDRYKERGLKEIVERELEMRKNTPMARFQRFQGYMEQVLARQEEENKVSLNSALGAVNSAMGAVESAAGKATSAAQSIHECHQKQLSLDRANVYKSMNEAFRDACNAAP